MRSPWMLSALVVGIMHSHVVSASEMPRCESHAANRVLEIYSDGYDLAIEEISCKPALDPSTRAFVKSCQVDTANGRSFSVVLNRECGEFITISELPQLDSLEKS